MIKLTNRLEECVKYTRGYNRLADIGTDHALLVSYAVLNGYVNDGIASDVSKGPLKYAQKTIDRYELNSKVTVKLANGLIEVDDKADVCVIAGMGGLLITDILENGKAYVNNVKRFIVQPNIASNSVRKWICNNEYQIVDEHILEESDKIYEIIVFEKGRCILNESEIYFGPYLLKEKNEIFLKKYTMRKERIENLLLKIPNDDDNREELLIELELINNEIGVSK